MSGQDMRDAILAATERLIQGNPLRSDGKLTIKSLAIEAAVPRHQLTEVHTDLKDAFYARVRNEQEQPAALALERQRRVAAEQNAAEWRERARLAEAQVDELVRALHVVTQSASRAARTRTHLASVNG